VAPTRAAAISIQIEDSEADGRQAAPAAVIPA
jgi:hypothetical protein